MFFIKRLFRQSSSIEEDNFIVKIQNILGFKPVNIEAYKLAFTHSSANKHDLAGKVLSYERLEFLGDAILSSVISAHLFYQAPNGDEGYLTKMRAKVVSRENLNELGKSLGLIDLVESKANPRHFGDNIYGNLFEALVGAIYMDKGYAFCEKFINDKLIKPYIDIEKLEGKIISYKSLLIEWCQKNKRHFEFKSFEEDSKDQLKHFSVQLLIDEKVIAKARATSKKKAEEIAAKRGYFVFQDKINS